MSLRLFAGLLLAVYFAVVVREREIAPVLLTVLVVVLVARKPWWMGTRRLLLPELVPLLMLLSPLAAIGFGAPALVITAAVISAFASLPFAFRQSRRPNNS